MNLLFGKKTPFFKKLVVEHSCIIFNICSTVTSEDVTMLYHTKRQVNMHYNLFITAVCLLFLIKLKWPKDKIVYDIYLWKDSRLPGCSLQVSRKALVARRGPF